MTIKVTYNVTDVYMSQSVSPVYINVSYSDGGALGGGVWGSITGTLSNQTDLQNALNAKFDDPTGTTTQYIDGTGALQTFPLTLPVLQEVRNQTGATLDAGTVVYINGATGNKPTVTKAIATGDATSAQTLGMISSAIANNGVGYVVVIGTCGGLDTSAYTEGQQLYLSGTVAGGVTTTKPYAPIHLVYVGIVTRAHPNLGTIEVRVQNGIEVDEIHNVSAQTPSNNDGLFYNTTTSLWESKAITTALGYTPVPTTRNITINGVTYDLSADRTWTIAAGISGSGASGQVTYWTGASAVSGSNNLFWDNTNGRLGIGTNAPASRLSVTNTVANEFIATFRASGSPNPSINIEDGDITIPNYSGVGFIPPPTSNTIAFISSNTGAGGGLGFTSFTNSADERALFFTGISGRTTATANSVVTFRAAKHDGGTNATTLSVNDIAFQYNNWTSPLVRIMGSGNFIINNTTDSTAHKLQVYGDTLLRGSGATSATTALTVQNSSSTNLFTVRNDNRVGIGTNAPSDILHISAPSNQNAIINATINLSDKYAGMNMYDDTNSLTGSFAIGGTNTGSFSNNLLIGARKANGNLIFVRGVSGIVSATLFSTGNLLIQDGGTHTDISSALFQINSTTKGFLPPRMTTTQKNAIATPAAGLVVYDTTLNKLCVYTTAWETITSI